QTARKMANPPPSRQEQRLSLQELRNNILNDTAGLERMDQRIAAELSKWKDDQAMKLENISDDKRSRQSSMLTEALYITEQSPSQTFSFSFVQSALEVIGLITIITLLLCFVS
ncbi:hypothetical protein PENTCL1PPCAC_20951, partial [Pristionchus entomophagus]